MSRFYPEIFPEFEYEPTTDKFVIQRISDGVGEGVVALVDFEPGDIVFRFTGVFSADVTLFTLQVNEHLHLHDPIFMGKILHCCDANCSVDMQTRTFTAVKPLRGVILLRWIMQRQKVICIVILNVPVAQIIAEDLYRVIWIVKTNPSRLQVNQKI